ncbi:MAG: hypothetical protein ABI367_09365 [Mucilaginibacter sp.]
MKKLSISFSAIILILIFESFVYHIILKQSNLRSGIYNISDEQVGIKFELNSSGKFYFITPQPIVTTAHIKSIEVGMSPRVNYHTYPFISLVFDPAGATLIENAFAKYKYGRQTGLIIKNKLVSVIESSSTSSDGKIIRDGKLTIMSSTFTIEQLQEWKKEIESEKL